MFCVSFLSGPSGSTKQTLIGNTEGIGGDILHGSCNRCQGDFINGRTYLTALELD